MKNIIRKFLKRLQLKKFNIFFRSKSGVLIIGGIIIVIVFATVYVSNENKENKTVSAITETTITPSATISATITATISISPTTTPVKKINRTSTPTISPRATATPVPSKATTEALSISSIDPIFLWADYQNLGYQYVHIQGSGFDSNTQFAFVGTNGQVYYIGNVSRPSSHDFYGTIPSGLYNSYYKVSAHRYADNAFFETADLLVVSGSTQAEGTAPPPDYVLTPMPTELPTPTLTQN